MSEQEPKVVEVCDFTIAQNSSLKILLADGTRVNAQIIPVRINKFDKLLPDGQPMYGIQWQQIVDQIAPDDPLAKVLKKGV